jgi:hypothetical protein
MKEVIVLGAKIMPMNEIIEQLEEAIAEYKLDDSNKKAEGAIVLFSQMFALKCLLDRGESVSSILAGLEGEDSLPSMLKRMSKN